MRAFLIYKFSSRRAGARHRGKWIYEATTTDTDNYITTSWLHRSTALIYSRTVRLNPHANGFSAKSPKPTACVKLLCNFCTPNHFVICLSRFLSLWSCPTTCTFLSAPSQTHAFPIYRKWCLANLWFAWSTFLASFSSSRAFPRGDSFRSSRKPAWIHRFTGQAFAEANDVPWIYRFMRKFYRSVGNHVNPLIYRTPFAIFIANACVTADTVKHYIAQSHKHLRLNRKWYPRNSFEFRDIICLGKCLSHESTIHEEGEWKFDSVVETLPVKQSGPQTTLQDFAA